MADRARLEAALAHQRQSAETYLADLEALVRIPSVGFSGFPPEEVKRSAEATAALLSKRGLENVEVLTVEGTHPYVYGDWLHAGLTEMPSQIALLGAAHAQQTLEAGFTTVRVVGTGNFSDVALRNAINAGWIPGPRIVAAGVSFTDSQLRAGT